MPMRPCVVFVGCALSLWMQHGLLTRGRGVQAALGNAQGLIQSNHELTRRLQVARSPQSAWSAEAATVCQLHARVPLSFVSDGGAVCLLRQRNTKWQVHSHPLRRPQCDSQLNLVRSERDESRITDLEIALDKERTARLDLESQMRVVGPTHHVLVGG
jgi:hypothetical protein